MNLRILIPTLILAIAIAGCAAPSAAPAAAPVAPAAAQAAPAIDLASLPVDVDVATAAKLRESPDVVILDVREQSEWDEVHIPGATLIPMGDIPARIKEIPTDKTVIVQCRSGNRSSQVTDYLRQQGMTNVHNLTGGMNEWEAAGLPVER
ncbi:MAG: rhodanese-like domain-containing protein [Caldilineaceae bacterium]|nr:rhodanese-like domain-containing protein [Caldilineaceae bacterium]